jgi:hypothetical protein
VSLSERISKQDRRETVVTPIIERRGGESQRVPEWRKRAMEQHARNPWSAVTDLTEQVA